MGDDQGHGPCSADAPRRSPRRQRACSTPTAENGRVTQVVLLLSVFFFVIVRRTPLCCNYLVMSHALHDLLLLYLHHFDMDGALRTSLAVCMRTQRMLFALRHILVIDVTDYFLLLLMLRISGQCPLMPPRTT
jgi:hypothetical protein